MALFWTRSLIEPWALSRSFTASFLQYLFSINIIGLPYQLLFRFFLLALSYWLTSAAQSKKPYHHEAKEIYGLIPFANSAKCSCGSILFGNVFTFIIYFSIPSWQYYMFEVNNRNTMARCKICSKLVIMKSERHHWFRSGVFIVNFEHISHFFLVFLLLTLMPTGYLYLTVQFQHTFFYFDKLQSFSEWIPDGEKYSGTIHGVYWIREWGMVIVDLFLQGVGRTTGS